MNPKKYHMKPESIEAVQWNALDGWDAARRIAKWCGGSPERDNLADNHEKTYYWAILIPTLKGTMTARPGDYIVKGVNGQFYPCKPGIFAKTYEEVAA